MGRDVRTARNATPQCNPEAVGCAPLQGDATWYKGVLPVADIGVWV